jgi:signal transduction histidine kinase
MAEILQMDIFFFITSVAVVLFTILLCVAVYQIIKILKAVRRIIDRIEEGTEVLADDIDNIRTSFNPTRLISFIMGMMPNGKK